MHTMVKTLEEKIKERKQQAKERDIIGKAQLVAEKLGVRVKLKDDDDAKMEGHRYERHGQHSLLVTRLEVHAFPTQGFSGRSFISVGIQYDGKTRFSSEGDEILSYIPGDWEGELDSLCEEYSVQAKQNADDYAKRELRERAAKFGL